MSARYPYDIRNSSLLARSHKLWALFFAKGLYGKYILLEMWQTNPGMG